MSQSVKSVFYSVGKFINIFSEVDGQAMVFGAKNGVDV